MAAPALDAAARTGSTDANPVLWLFLAVLITFVIARVVTRWIRARTAKKKTGGLVGDITLGGVHIHHQVFGILLMFIAGIFLIAVAPNGVGLDLGAAVFGVGVGLAFDEFALWLHLDDVYWSDEGRRSVDAVFCVLVVTGVLIGGADLLIGRAGTSRWWSSVGWLGFFMALSVICMLKGKVVTGVIGIIVQPIAIIGSIRLAKPDSWWAHRRYGKRPARMARAQRRFGEKYVRRWNRLRDLVAGAPDLGPAARQGGEAGRIDS